MIEKSFRVPFKCGLFVLFLWSLQVKMEAQQRLYVLCEGAQDFYSGEVIQSPALGAVDLGVVNPEFTVLRSFEGHAYATDLLLADDGASLFVSAEDTVYRLDAGTGEVLAQQALQGARKLAQYGDRVYVSRGDYDPLTWASVVFDEYLVALNAESLAWEAAWQADGIAGPAFASEGVFAEDGALYVAVNNAFAFGEEVGLVGRLDLASGQYEEADLGPEGLNPVHLFPLPEGGVLTVNAQQYDGTSLSRWAEGEPLTVPVADVTAGCGAAAWQGDGVLFQVYGEGDFRKADGTTLNPLQGWSGNGMSAYSMAVSETHGVALGMTDFTSTGHVELWDFNEGLTWAAPTGIAPGRMVFSQEVSSVADADLESNPVREVIQVWDILGRPLDRRDAEPGILSFIRWSDGSVTKELKARD
jgi:hypothetical protein